MKKSTAIIIWVIGILLLPIILYLVDSVIPFNALGDWICNIKDCKRYYHNEGPAEHWGIVHIIFSLIYAASYLIWVIFGGILIFADDPKGEEIFDDKDDDSIKKPIRNTIIAIFSLLALIFIGKYCFIIGKDCKEVYNANKVYNAKYIQKVQAKKGFYDKLWKTYIQKEKITSLNKETFLQVTQLIMENRADGENLTWKWVSENQKIPYEEFTAFYADLSNFVEQQRKEYYNIELDCQYIAQSNNTMLDTFPNNIYNKVLKCNTIQFEYGFLSDKTDSVFTNKKENLTF